MAGEHRPRRDARSGPIFEEVRARWGIDAPVTELVERYRSEYPAFVPVSYVEFEPQGVNGIVANPAWYRAQNLKVLVQTAPYTIYDVRPLWSSPG
jgi:hypothetical protein